MNSTNVKIKKDLSISMVAANNYSLIFALPLTILFLILFLISWEKSGLIQAYHDIVQHTWLFILFVLAGIFLHELIHGMAWTLLGKKSMKTIRYGVNWKVLSPYAHCREALPIQAYRLGALLPAVIQGFIPVFIGLLTGSGVFFLCGLIFTAAAGGDLVILWLLRNESSKEWVLDHDSRAGCYIIDGSVT